MALARKLGDLFHIATRVPELRPGKANRVIQIRSEGDRHLADLRLAEHPQLRDEETVVNAIRAIGGGDPELQAWQALVLEPLVSDEESDEGY